MRILGLILVLVVLMVGIGSNLPSLIYQPSIIITVGGTVAALSVRRTESRQHVQCGVFR